MTIKTQRTDIVIELEALLNQQGQAVNDWFTQQYQNMRPPFYGSVDLRHSDFKIVPVDTNLFPAGFNHLSDRAKQRARISFKRRIAAEFGQATKIMLLGESHTRNKGYLENLQVLAGLLSDSGAEIRIGRLPSDEVSETSITLETLSGGSITQEVIRREGDKLQLLCGWQPDVIILNNDLSSGLPDILHMLAQPVVPSLNAGWYRRRKSRHFQFYTQMAEAFSTAFKFDLWKISTLSLGLGQINFKQRENLDAVAQGIDKMLLQIQQKYDEYGVSETPYVYIKADAGTYGMGIMTARSSADVLEMNKKLRNKMQVVKDGALNAQILLQEGVPTADRVNDAPAEPMLYAIDGMTVGGAFRVNPERDAYRNLNASGMFFTGMCDREEAEQGDTDHVPVLLCNYQVYGLITRLANLAAALELDEMI